MSHKSPTACKFPGCVAEVVRGDTCPVHATATTGKPCDRCHGRGLYFYAGQKIEMACQYCGGTGFKDAKVSTAIPKRERVPIDQRGLIQASEE